MHSRHFQPQSVDSGIRAVAGRFEEADKRLVRARKLLERNDTKFLVPSSLATWILARVIGDYKIVHRRGSPISPYRTDYYDTTDLRCFFDHVHGKHPRFKVRIRRYLDGKCFFEVKTKQSCGSTRKYRLRRTNADMAMSIHERDLVRTKTGLDVSDLRRSVGVNYLRLTLVSPNTDERVTVDLNVTLRVGAQQICFPNVAIFEAKQRALDAKTPIVRALASHGIRPSGASKYCSAMALADDSLAIGYAAQMLERLEQADERNERNIRGSDAGLSGGGPELKRVALSLAPSIRSEA